MFCFGIWPGFKYILHLLQDCKSDIELIKASIGLPVAQWTPYFAYLGVTFQIADILALCSDHWQAWNNQLQSTRPTAVAISQKCNCRVNYCLCGSPSLPSKGLLGLEERQKALCEASTALSCVKKNLTEKRMNHLCISLPWNLQINI